MTNQNLHLMMICSCIRRFCYTKKAFKDCSFKENEFENLEKENRELFHRDFDQMNINVFCVPTQNTINKNL